MAQVSIGQVENLAEATVALEACLGQAQEECMAMITQVEQKLEETQASLIETEHALESAQEYEQASIAAVEQAAADLKMAEYAVSDAQAELTACELMGSYDENGNFEPPDCSGEEGALAQAENELDDAHTNNELAQQRREEATRQRIVAEQKAELAQQNYSQAGQLAEQVNMACTAHSRSMETLVSEGKSRLAHAQDALNAYLASTPDAKAVYDWLKWQPAVNKPVSPGDIYNRMNLSMEQHRVFLQYLTDRNPGFREKIAGYRKQLDEAKDEAERAAVLTQMRSNLSGAYAEQYVAHALGVLGTEVKAHVKHDLKSGSYTFTDLVITGLKEPVILGRGKGMSAPKGGSIAIEIKNGKASYLKKQKDHMVIQAEGHQNADASITICTRDIKDLSPEEEASLREALQNAGSPLIGMLPRKDETDEMLWKAVKGGNNAG